MDSVLNNFFKYGTEKRYLLALSGGLDSCVLFHLMHKAGLNFAAAHVNYSLRGSESVEDELFVREMCSKNHITLFVNHMNINDFKKNYNASTQSAARELRYQWFSHLQNEWPYDFLVTAHHLNDAAETFLINFIRGTGLIGLTGISSTDTIFRPLLNYSREEILQFALLHNLSWREDSSNAGEAYIRNKIRHKIIPEFMLMNSEFLQSFENTINHLRNDVCIIDEHIAGIREDIFQNKRDYFSISIDKLKALENPNVLFYLFKPFGFKHTFEIIKLFDSVESAEIQSEEFRLIKNRNELILAPKFNENSAVYTINDLKKINHPIALNFSVLHSKPKNIKDCYDFNRIKFPLSLRLRQEGDIFYPEGMKGKSKKVSKYFKDEKFSKLDKENAWILTDAHDQIIWIVGKRRDERFIAKKDTTIWLRIEKLD